MKATSAIRDEQRDDRSRAELSHRLQAMVAVRRPVAVVLADRDDRIEKAAERLDHVHQPLDVRLRGIALKRRRLDAVDRQRGEQHRRPAERLAIRRQHHAAVGFDLSFERSRRRRVDISRVGGGQADGLGRRFLAASYCAFLAIAQWGSCYFVAGRLRPAPQKMNVPRLVAAMMSTAPSLLRSAVCTIDPTPDRLWTSSGTNSAPPGAFGIAHGLIPVEHAGPFGSGSLKLSRCAQ